MQSLLQRPGVPGPTACFASAKRRLPPRLIKTVVRAAAEDAEDWDDEVWRRPRGLGELPVSAVARVILPGRLLACFSTYLATA
jgi:hypothetical protein